MRVVYVVLGSEPYEDSWIESIHRFEENAAKKTKKLEEKNTHNIHYHYEEWKLEK